MSLSKPNSPVFITESAAPSSQSVGMLDTNENATRVNQLHGITSNNAIGAGIPNQVTSVQVSVANAQIGATCTVAVLYRVDPTDRNFAGVNIWVKGYQGNTQLVKVASGASSPTKFVLNNTGETVSFTIQAYGNGGSAPLTSAPTCSGTLPQATGGGFGSSTSTSPTPAAFKTNGVNNASQSLLNITSGNDIRVSNPSGGVVKIDRISYRNFAMARAVPSSVGMTGVGCAPSSAGSFGAGAQSTATEPTYSLMSTTASSGSQCRFQSSPTTTVSDFETASFRNFEFQGSLPTSTSVRIWMGACQNVSLVAPIGDTPVNMMGFRYSTAAGDTNWMGYSDQAGSNTSFNTGVAIDTASHKFLITNDGSTLTFYIDGVQVGMISTNVPLVSTVILPMVSVETLTTAIRTFRLSYVYWDRP